ncbi:RHS repeat-associated core domain-containing protein, partial [Enterobacter cloacae complex sp. P31C]|uniref:RHS repeat-associated core domain-containing protein n=1 Tax=Enterobacter cloacae complex sp. P31C TaxID=2779560 RepID=UPI00351C05C8
VRYSGKERDATGLYHYGYRYYQPWSGRWLSADPAGTVDGLNLFRMCRNNPATFQDPNGKQSTFSDLFSPQRGDLIFGLSRDIGMYTSYWSKLTRRGDYLAVYLHPEDAIETANHVSSYRIYINKYFIAAGLLNANASQENLSAEEVDTLENMITSIDKAIDETVNVFSRKITDRFKGYTSSLQNKKTAGDFIKAFTGGEHYDLHETILQYGDDHGTVFSKKIVSRGSKAGISMLLEKGNDARIHFVLDNIDMDKVISKNDNNSITGSELRFLYRNRNKLEGKVHFYVDHKEVKAPWVSNSARWRKYESRKID